MEDMKKKYEVLRNKYSLPSLTDLTREFCIKLDNPDLILQDIICKIKEKIIDNATTIESIIFVGSSENLSNLYETKMLNNKKKEIFEFYKELMSITWKSRKVETTADEKEMADFIKETYDKWINKLKKQFVDICEKFEKGWKSAILGETPTEMMYLG
jgi:hypothetical protein